MPSARLLAAVALMCAPALCAPVVVAAQSRTGSGAPDAARAATVRTALPDSQRIALAIQAFLLLSRQQWIRSEDQGHEPLHGRDGFNVREPRRLTNVHCHWDGTGGDQMLQTVLKARPEPMIRSELTRFAICPDWQQGSGAARIEASFDPTAELSELFRLPVLEARTRLLRELEAADRAHPGNPFLTAQRVRFLLEAGEPASALGLVEPCTTDESLCARLAGLAFYVGDRVPDAEDRFARALASMPSTMCCEWQSIRRLLPPASRVGYDSLPCAARESLERTAWWLADPMYAEPGNERRAEHFARLTRLELVSALPITERWNMTARDGADAVQSLLVRYGWPSRSYHGGWQLDLSHSSYLGPDATPPYSGPEYLLGRIATFPAWAAIEAPFTASDSDFVLGPPGGRDPLTWWPQEHFWRRAGSITTFDPGQLALFRRDSAAMLTVMTRLDAPALRQSNASAMGITVRAAYMVSSHPDSVYALGRQAARVGSSVMVQSLVAPGQYLGGFEILGSRDLPVAARSRSGFTAPPTLASMKPGETAVSDPVLFMPDALDALERPAIENIADVMYPTLTLAGVARLGVFWESYGFSPRDTVDVSVELSRVTAISGIRRLGMILQVTDDPNGSVRVSWREPSPDRITQSIPAARPILARHVVLNSRGLESGTYRVRITMRRVGAPEVSSERVFKLTKR